MHEADLHGLLALALVLVDVLGSGTGVVLGSFFAASGIACGAPPRPGWLPKCAGRMP